jgi:uncharacterized protein DUF3850
MPPKVHDLKTWPPLYAEAAEGRMPFQIRRNDRDYQVGHHLRLQEFDPQTQTYTGRECERRITAIFSCEQLLAGEGRPVLAKGFVVLGIVPVPYGQSLTQDQRPDHIAA